MRTGTTYHDVPTVYSGGVDGLGFVCQIDITDTGDLAVRTDTETGYYRDAIAGELDAVGFQQAFRYGDNIAESELIVQTSPESHKGLHAGQVYELVQDPSNKNHMIAAAYGRLYKTVDRGANWTRMTGFKSGNYDESIRWQGTGGEGAVAKLTHKHMAIDPINPLIYYFGHPKDGLYISTDGGTTWALKAGTVPVWDNVGNCMGIDVALDRTTSNGSSIQTIVLLVNGVGVLRSTTGNGGAFTAVGTGSPTICSQIVAKGGRIISTGNGGDAQTYLWNGSAWSAPTDITGATVGFRPTTNEVLVMTGGGGMHYSTDSGDTWSSIINGVPFENDGAEVPVIATTESNFMSVGGFVWHPTLQRIIACSGIGVFQFDGPFPRSSDTQLWKDKTLGIKQLLIMSMCVTENKVYATAQDRPVFVWDKNAVAVQASNHGPDYRIPIRHGTFVSASPTDENYAVMVQILDAVRSMFITTDGGESWTGVPTWPENAGASGITEGLVAGCVAVGVPGNIVWAPTNKNRMMVTNNGGTSWSNPVFRDQSNNVLDLSDVVWGHAYFSRRRTVEVDPSNPSNFVCYSYGREDGANVATKAGIFHSTDGGFNWTRTHTGKIPQENYFTGQIQTVAGHAGCIFWANGPSFNELAINAPDGLYFSSTYGASLFTMPGWNEVYSVTVGKAKQGSSFPTIYVSGWRDIGGGSNEVGIWACTDFNPASPGSATWVKRRAYANGRKGVSNVYGDMWRYGDLYIETNSGGFFFDKADYKLVINPT